MELMKFGLTTGYFYDFSPEEALVQFAAIGCMNLDLSSKHAEVLLQRGQAEKVGLDFHRSAVEHGLEVPMGHLMMSTNLAAENYMELIDNLKRWLDLYMAIGIKYAVVHPGGKDLLEQGYDQGYVNERRVRVLNVLTDYIKGTDISICVENIKAIQYVEGLLTLVEMVGSKNIGICLDTGHLKVSKGDPAAFIRKAGPHLKALHIHDNDGNSDQHLLPFSWEGIDWKEVMAALKEINYQHIFDFEIKTEARSPIEIRYEKFEYIKKLYKIMTEW